MPSSIRSHSSGYQSLHDDNEKEPKDYRDRTARRQLIIRRVVAAVVSFIFIYSVLRVVNLVHRSVLKNDPGLRPIETLNSPSGSLKSKLETCSDTASPSHPPPARPPSPVNLWASLTIKETSEIQRWLEHPARSLNLTRGKESRPSDNTIFIIETFYPPKASALAYFDSLTDSKEVKPPARYARVTIHHGSGLPSPGDPIPQVKDYLVGPLPIGNGSATTIRELNEIYHLSRIPYNARGMVNGIEFSDAWKLIYGELREAIEDLLNSTIRGKPSDGLVVSGSGPWSFDGSFRRLWTTFKKNVPGSWIQATGLYIYLDMGGTDTSLWKFTKVVYNNQYFKSVSAFLEAYRNGSIKRYPPPSPPSSALSNYTTDRTDTTWSSRNRRGERRDLDHLPGPRSVAFAGLRFRVNRELGYVSWMGWGMYLGFDRDMGLSLWDVRFQGERVVYQLAPQEALAHYAGADPIQSSMSWQDRYWGMGQFVSNMLPGYDCPHNAVYLPATTRTPLGSTTVERAICVFEHDTERPLTRHTSYVDGEFGAVKGYVLVVRSITPVGK
ncbi:hypothetical protein E1B28_004834 [Marasmius oreades]|uniref:Amine oxidase n=1 Tax=Marasmius oreades TaxID=181124 RepID=A0A9P7UZF9_9AGAR|nr:uncharacterized protein E1B28_004834 [Marasmius oreades]KAG7097492.1 hypothetical protein E1B28_004834 [Marasmius oreades]